MFFTGLASRDSATNQDNSNNIWSSPTESLAAPDSGLTQSSTSSIWGDFPPQSNIQSSSPDLSRPICRYFLQGHCSAGMACGFSHDLGTQSFGFERYICEICSEDIVSRGVRFGLLENCDHIFCLNCIREWRSQREKQDRHNLRKCPICRVDSFIIIPSSRFLQGQEKNEERERYKSSVSGIPCKNFNYGKGICQFGTSCMYLHLNEDDSGSLLRHVAPINEFKMIQGADGKKTKKQTQLSDFVKLR